MKKIYLFSACCIFSYHALHAQAVGIGTASPNASAMLDVTSTSRGFLMPRMTSAQRIAIVSPAAGLTVYETTSNVVWVYNGSGWVQMASGGVSPWTVAGTHIYNNNADNVGIGTSSPTAKYHLVGNFLQDNGTMTLNNSAGIIQFQNAGVNKGYLQLSGDNLRMGTFGGNGVGKMIIRMDGSDKITIDSTGNMQIVGEQDVSLSTHGYLTLGSIAATNMILDRNEIMVRNNGAASNLILQNDGGNVGIANANPVERLDIDGSARLTGGSRALKMETSVAGPSGQFTVFKYAPGMHFIRADGTLLGKMEYVDTLNYSNFLRFHTGSAVSNDLTINSNHNIGIGTTGPTEKLQVAGNTLISNGGYLYLAKTSGLKTVEIKPTESGTDGASMLLYNRSGVVTIEMDGDYADGDGRIITGELQIKGGSDLAENFDLTGVDDSEVKPGMLVSIDTKNEGKLCITSLPVDKALVGVISGANGIKPGMLMGQQGSIAFGKYPVALAGRVYVLTNAEGGEINPGDFLTSSTRKGYATKASPHSDNNGAIIGKAMGKADGKTGLVLVLVNLQ